MNTMFSVLDRQNVLDYIVSVSLECDKIVALVQVGSGAVGYNDDWSDLDFVIALDAKDSKAEAMNYMQQRISEKYKTSYFSQHDERNLQCYVLSNLLEIARRRKSRDQGDLYNWRKCSRIVGKPFETDRVDLQ